MRRSLTSGLRRQCSHRIFFDSSIANPVYLGQPHACILDPSLPEDCLSTCREKSQHVFLHHKSICPLLRSQAWGEKHPSGHFDSECECPLMRGLGEESERHKVFWGFTLPHRHQLHLPINLIVPRMPYHSRTYMAFTVLMLLN